MSDATRSLPPGSQTAAAGYVPSRTIEPSLSGSGMAWQRSGGEKDMPWSVEIMRMRLCLPCVLLSQGVGLQQCALPFESSESRPNNCVNGAAEGGEQTQRSRQQASGHSCIGASYSSRIPSSNCSALAAGGTSSAC